MRPETRDAASKLRSSLVRGDFGTARCREALAGIPEDERDGWLDVVLNLGGLPEDDALLPRGCVPYLPCPLATVLEALETASVTSDDVFVDVGAGLGRASVLTHLVTGAACIGIEIQPRLVEGARSHAAELKLHGVQFLEGDASDMVRSVAAGTVFFAYCPFGRDRWERFLDGLETIARTRTIRVCCVGLPPVDRPWLAAIPDTSVDLAVYRSTFHSSADEQRGDA